MFSKKQRNQINEAVNLANTGLVKDGETVTRGGNKAEVPNIFELRKQAVDKLIAQGFTVRPASPKEANAIIRVYSDKNLQFGKNQYWAYGAEVFVKGLWKMWTTKEVKSIRDSIRDPFRNYVPVRTGPYRKVIKNVKDFADYHFVVTK